MTKHIILFDGTWNKPDANVLDGDESTNVVRIKNAIVPTTINGVRQLIWYEQGVGTNWYDHVAGGTFGTGLSEKIQAAYKHLARNYSENDEIYIFGFSRGAYSARSLVGLIRNAGLLRSDYLELVTQAYSLYRTRDDSADTEAALEFRKKYSREVSIKFLGVWDTVGALGIPFESFNDFNNEFYKFHDTELSGIVKNAFHAIAIDEHRANFSATLWDPKIKPNQRLEQVWFSGAHANIGGGYPNDNLADVPLYWMIDRAVECELEITCQARIANVDLVPIAYSYGDFMSGAYKLITPRHYRNIGTTQYGNESIHQEVVSRLSNNPTYKPKNSVGDHLIGGFTPSNRLRI